MSDLFLFDEDDLAEENNVKYSKLTEGVTLNDRVVPKGTSFSIEEVSDEI